MKTVMCESCGEFVQATEDGETVVPVSDSCPQCGGEEFRAVGTDAAVRADE